MKRELAWQLLNNLLPESYSEKDLQSFFNDLRVLAEYKYNQYEMYQPGRLFFENLYLWLLNFDNVERTVALNFVKRNLIFISRNEFQQLAQLLYYDQIRQKQLDLASAKTGIPRYRVKQLAESESFKRIQRLSLYVAMSDGARIDYFRRQNLNLNNEQVLAVYYANSEKVQNILSDLQKTNGEGAKFECLFLIDDFCGSGRTLLREIVRVDLPEPISDLVIPSSLASEITCKENKQLELAYRQPETLPCLEELQTLSTNPIYLKGIEDLLRKYDLRDTEINGSLVRIASSQLEKALKPDAKVFFCPLLVTEYAKHRLKQLTPRLSPPFNEMETLSGATIPDSLRIIPDSPQAESQGAILQLCHKYYSTEFEDSHTGNIKFGYDGCGLPVVLHHNTPNNSLFFLWSRKLPNPLFIRYERHGRTV